MLQLVDDKNRVSIPAKFREAAIVNSDTSPDPKGGGTVYIGTHPYSPCLIGFDAQWLDSELERASDEAKADPSKPGNQHFNVLRRTAGGAEPTAFDGGGRCVLVGWQKKKVGIGKHAFFYGSITCFEIWDPETLLATPDELADPAIKDACRGVMEEKGLL